MNIETITVFRAGAFTTEPAPDWLQRINALAERTYTHQSSVSVVVRRLVEQGLVARRPATGDARRRELRLTTAGRRLVERAPMPAQLLLIQGLTALGPLDLATLSRLLERVVQAMGASDQPPTMLFVDGSRRRARRNLTLAAGTVAALAGIAAYATQVSAHDAGTAGEGDRSTGVYSLTDEEVAGDGRAGGAVGPGRRRLVGVLAAGGTVLAAGGGVAAWWVRGASAPC